MAQIRILPDRVANQIAAGEVIERPAAVVKELVENALDAGATRIEVEFRQGGRSLLRVEDNGSGMGRDQALLALERHATSKISEAEDLNTLGTYGFRGEALPSIASISRFTLQTRERAADTGTEILVNGGRLVHVRECGKPVGTRIEVAQLFHPVPARRKFLKSDQTEAAHIIQCVRLYALACHAVSFTLLEDGRLVFRSPECARLEDRVCEIFGRQFAGEMLELDAREGDMCVHGLIGKPLAARPTRHEMICFVNGRPVDSRTLNYALLESYHEYIPKGRYPLAFVFFEINPGAVDVNVHPAKREVRFRSEAAVRGFLMRAVLQRLREMGESTATAFQALPAETLPAAPSPSTWVPSAPFRSPAPSFAKPFSSPGIPAVPPSAPVAPSSVLPPSAVSALAPTRASPPLNAWRFIGLLHTSYALFETPAGLVILERKACLERIWYERLLTQYGQDNVVLQRLLIPSTLELDAIGAALLLDHLPFVQKHGMEIQEFGRNFFRIEAIPDWMEPEEASAFVQDLLGALRDGRFEARDEIRSHEQFARLASTRAVRLPSRVSETEMLALLKELFSCATPLSSPSGRPTFIEVPHSELSRRLQK